MKSKKPKKKRESRSRAGRQNKSRELPASEDSGAEKKPQASSPRVAKWSNGKAGLVAENLCKSYKKRPVLKSVSVRVQQGEAVALLGANGAGKTTCFSILTGLLNLDSGKISLDGADITHLSMYRRAAFGLGYLPQEASIFRGMNVENNIRSVLQTRQMNADQRDAMLEKLISDFSINHIRHTAATALSGGERRRVEIARALAAEPRFVLLDEPLAGIDPVAVADIRNLVSQLKDEGIGVLITDHNVRETLSIVDRAYVLDDGHILHEGTPIEIASHPTVRKVYLGDDFEL